MHEEVNMSEHEGEALELDEQKANQEGGEELSEGHTHVQPAADDAGETEPAEPHPGAIQADDDPDQTEGDKA
jgi:hypothetical protein